MGICRPGCSGAIGIALFLSAAEASAQATTAPDAPPQYGAALSPPQQQVLVVPAYSPVTLPTPPPPPQLVPRPIQVERSENIRPLWITGVIALPVSWLLTWTAASSTYVGDAVIYSWIPVIGPWLMLTQDLNGGEGPTIFSGVVQGLATLAIVLGLSIQRTWTETQWVLDPATGSTATLGFDLLGTPGGAIGVATLSL